MATHFSSSPEDASSKGSRSRPLTVDTQSRSPASGGRMRLGGFDFRPADSGCAATARIRSRLFGPLRVHWPGSTQRHVVDPQQPASTDLPYFRLKPRQLEPERRRPGWGGRARSPHQSPSPTSTAPRAGR